MHNLLRRPSGWYFRIKIPQSLRPFFCQRFFVRALGTADYLTARAAAAVLYLQYRDAFQRLKGRAMKPPSVSELLAKIKKEDIREAVRIGSITRRGVHDMVADTPAELTHAFEQLKNFDFSKLPDGPAAAPKGENLYALIDLFLEEKEPSGVKLKTTRQYGSTLRLFKIVVADKPINEVSDADIDAFKALIKKWPTNAHKRRVFKDKSPEEILELNKTAKIKTLVAQSQHHHVKRTNTFFIWCVNERKLAGINPLYKRSTVVTKKKSRRSVGSGTSRNKGFFDSQLKNIFNPETYLGFKIAADYWCPLVMLFSGARINEIAQLYCDDVMRHGKIDYIYIHAKRQDMSIKNAPSERFVPLHPKLISLGFVEYVKCLRKAGIERVFFELPPSKANGYGDAAAGHLNTYLKNIGEKEEGKITHAFRHLFADTLKQKGVHPDLVEELLGHELPGQREVYTNVLNLPDKLKHIKKATFPEVNIRKIKVPLKRLKEMITAIR
jgi:integrase